jgi:hypothetical protein
MNPWITVSLSSFTIMFVALAWAPLKRWIKKCKRRKGGVYGWRVRHHLYPTKRVWGYVGESVSFALRKQQHLGSSRFDPRTGQPVKSSAKGMVMLKVPAQPWTDLDPVMHVIIPLPWWLCWKWVLRPLETLAMLCTWPVYNDAKNHWNPRRIPKNLAKIQRARRDAGTVAYKVTVATGRWLGTACRVVGLLLILAGLGAALSTL